MCCLLAARTRAQVDSPGSGPAGSAAEPRDGSPGRYEDTNQPQTARAGDPQAPEQSALDLSLRDRAGRFQATPHPLLVETRPVAPPQSPGQDARPHDDWL